MSNRKNNYPTGELENLDPEYVSTTIGNLKQLYNLKKPETDDEIEQRINDFFSFCQDTEMRPGIETLSLSLGISRATLYRWSRGEGCSQRRTDIINHAKALIDAFLEESSLQGKLNPATSIFLMKNWMNYRDNSTLEVTTGYKEYQQDPGEIAADIAARHLTESKEVPLLPPEKPSILELSDN